MTRLSFLVAGLLLVVTGCAGPTPSPVPTATTGATFSASALAGGCGDTPLWTGGGPEWTASADAGQLPFAVSHEGNLFAGLFAHPLRAGTAPADPANKILWIVREPRDGQPLKLTIRPADGQAPVVSLEEPANSGPGEIYPSIVDVPTPGCWTVTAEWGGHRATLELAWV